MSMLNENVRKLIFYKLGTGNPSENSLTFWASFARYTSSSAWVNPSCIKRIICLISCSLTPLVVIAGVPIRSQDGRKGGFGSFGIVDLLVEIPILSRVFSALVPSKLDKF